MSTFFPMTDQCSLSVVISGCAFYSCVSLIISCLVVAYISFPSHSYFNVVWVSSLRITCPYHESRFSAKTTLYMFTKIGSFDNGKVLRTKEWLGSSSVNNGYLVHLLLTAIMFNLPFISFFVKCLDI